MPSVAFQDWSTARAAALDEIENAGHRFGEDLSEPDKQALTAFLATL